MDASQNSILDGACTGSCESAEDRRAVLAVADIATWVSAGRPIPRSGQLLFAEFHEINSELLWRVDPAMVISPLLCRTFDCVDLAQLLGSLGYSGRYRAIDSGLPDPCLITREVRLLVPNLDFDIATFC